MNAIQANDLTKIYGLGRTRLKVVDRLMLEVQEGIVFGFLGPNGAGKTTTIRMLTGVLAPTSGQGEVAGISLRHPDALKSRIGYANQSASVYANLSVEENLSFKARLYLPPKEVRPAVERTIERLTLEDFRRTLAGSLSGGWRQRLSVATALVHNPKVLFLDEPTAGLDPVARRALWDVIYALSLEGTTLFVTTHAMDEAERCHRVALVASGRVLADGAPDLLRAEAKGRYYHLEPHDLAATLREVRKLPGVTDAWINGAGLRVATEPSLSAHDLGRFAANVQAVPATLEDVFVSLNAQNGVSA